MVAPVAAKVALAADAFAAWNKETTWGTQVNLSGSSEFSLFINENIDDDFAAAEPPTITQAHRLSGQLFNGPVTVGGTIDFPLTYQGFENPLLHACGEINNAGAGSSSGTFVRDFDLAHRGRYKVATGSPSLSLHIARGVVGSSGNVSNTIYSFPGTIIDEFELRLGGPFAHLSFIPNFLCKTSAQSVSTQAPSFPTSPIVNGTECVMTWGGVEVFLQDFSVRVRRNHDRNRRRTSTRFIAEPPPGRYLVEGTFTTEWEGALRAGSPAIAMVVDYRQRTLRDLTFAFTSSTDIPSTSSPYLFNIQMPTCLITRYPNFIRSEGRVLVNVPFRAYASSATTEPYELRIHSQTGATFADN